MLKRVTFALLIALCATVSFNTAEAAFPTEKKSETATAIPVMKDAGKTTTQAFSNKEVKKESKLLKKSVNSSGGKSKILAALLALFLGNLGIHSFYMGQKQKGLLQLALTIAGYALLIIGLSSYTSGVGDAFPILAVVGLLVVVGVSIWAFVDFVRILTGSLAPEEGFDD